MKLKELLRLGNLNTCLLTIVGYCKMEKYEYLNFFKKELRKEKSDEEKMTSINNKIKENLISLYKESNRYFMIYGNHADYLLADCEDEDKKERIQNWINSFQVGIADGKD